MAKRSKKIEVGTRFVSRHGTSYRVVAATGSMLTVNYLGCFDSLLAIEHSCEMTVRYAQKIIAEAA